MRTFLSLGSNLGDRMEILRSAVRALETSSRITSVSVSGVYETAPVEVGRDHPDYLNCVLQVECSMPPMELLRYCQGVEAGLGRDRKGEMAPRTVDIDILLYGEEVVDMPELRIPHRGIERAFNLLCLRDISGRSDIPIDIPGVGPVGEIGQDEDERGVREYGEKIILQFGG